MDRDDMLQIKEESGNTEVDIGPTTLEEIDSHYKINQPDKQESTIDNNNVDPILSSGVKQECNEMELTGAEGQRLAQATLAPAGAGSVKQRIHITVEGTNLVIAPIQHSINQQNTIVVKTESKIAHDVNDPVLCSRVKEETGEDKRDEPHINICDYCQETFTNKESIEAHIRSHARGFFKGDQCGKSYRPKQYLMLQKADTHAAHMTKCNVCDTSLKATNLSYHMQHMHSNDDLLCKFCAETIKSVYCFQQHLNLRHGRASASKHGTTPNCHNQQSASTSGESQKHNECVREFQFESSFHVQTSYTGLLQYECAVCKRVYKSKQCLCDHLVQDHPPVFTVSPIINKCDHCQMVFSSEKKLNTHLANMHYIYRCSVCRVDFRNKPGLQSHMELMHPEEEYEVTPFINRCYFCKKIYSSKQYLAIHIRNMHGTGSYYECFECKMEFKSKAYLQTHMKMVHFIGVHRLLRQGQNQQSSRSNTVEDSSVSTHPPVDEVNATASASTPQQNAVVTKEELADEELELGPVVFQHMDSNYRPYKEESLPD